MDKLDNGVVLCQLAQLLQDKMMCANNGKVLEHTHTHVCTQIITKNSETQRYRMNSCLYEPQTKFPEQKAHVGFNLK